MAAIDTTPDTCSWKVYAGDRNWQEFALFADEDMPWDITGAVFTAQARLTHADVVVAIEALCTVTDPVGGRLTVEWDGEDVRALLAGSSSWAGVWDLEMLGAPGQLPTTLLTGKFSAHLDVTR